MAVLYYDALQKDHYAPLFSKSAFVTYLFIAITIILPFLLVIRTHNFWITESFFYEQPNIQHMNEMLVVIYTEQQTYSFGTTEAINSMLSVSKSLSPTIEIKHIDTNRDGNAEELHVDISLQNIDPRTIKSVLILQTLSYQLTEKVGASFKMPVYNIFDTPAGFKNFQASGQLKLTQKQAYHSGAIHRVIGYDTYDIAENLQKGSIFEFFNKIDAAESTLAFKSNSQFTTVPSDSSLGILTINLVMAVPYQQKFRLQMDLLDTIKGMWIQYLSVFILIACIIYKGVLCFAFRFNILESTVVSEIHKANMTVLKIKQQ